MGLFHKTLDDVEKEFRKGNYIKALSIVEQHINKEHSARGVFILVTELFSSFSGNLNLIEGALKDILSQKHSKLDLLDFENALNSAKDDLNGVLEHAEEFLELCRKEA